MSDETIVCRDCQQDFVFTEGERKFFEEKNFRPPVRCKACRQAKKADRGSQNSPY